MSSTSTPAKLPAFARAMMRLQAFLLRRNWLGALGEQVMVITVTGRRTGKTYSTPIGYLRDGPSILALTNARAGGPQWYRNLLRQPEVRLDIQGRSLRARGQPVSDPAEREHIFGLYRRERSAAFPRLFGVAAEAPAEALAQALAGRAFVRFEILDA